MVLSCSGLEADRLDQCVKVIDDAVIEAVELRPVLARGSGIGTDGAEFCDNLIFRRRAALDSLGERLLDADFFWANVAGLNNDHLARTTPRTRRSVHRSRLS